MANRRIDEPTGVETVGHEWDGIEELNNPLPRWWVIVLWATVIFSLGYVVVYPAIPLLDRGTQGLFGWTSRGQLADETAAAQTERMPVLSAIGAASYEAIMGDPQVLAQAKAGGRAAFKNNCAQCHGSDGKGSQGYPNLTDSDWLWGGSFDTIQQTIAQGRNGMMPPMAAAVGSSDDVRNVAHYVLSLSGSPHDNVAAQLGRSKFSACAACHGPDGKGNPALGAPNLSDKIWLHGWGESAIVAMVIGGKNNVMPAHAQRLSAEQIRVLAAYVWSLSNPATQ